MAVVFQKRYLALLAILYIVLLATFFIKPGKLRHKFEFKPFVAKQSSQRQEIRHGLVILGMHRSGTSVLSGLIQMMGFKIGDETSLFPPNSENEKGFFERMDVAHQNDAFMQDQGGNHSYLTHKYNHTLGLKMALNDINFHNGITALQFLNNKTNYPWMLKDPRLCVTLRTWIGLLDFVPAVLFTYRHPVDVTKSLLVRDPTKDPIVELKLWYIYNKRAILQSNDLCRIITSDKKILTSPYTELTRIYNEIKDCGITITHQVNHSEIASFVNLQLHHFNSTLKSNSYCYDDIFYHSKSTQQQQQHYYSFNNLIPKLHTPSFINNHNNNINNEQNTTNRVNVNQTIIYNQNTTTVPINSSHSTDISQNGGVNLSPSSLNHDILIPKYNPFHFSVREDVRVFREVMRVYCALEDGSAFQYNFIWDDSIQY